MPPIAPSEPSMVSSTASKKSKNKKKKNNKPNGDGSKLQKLDSNSRPEADDGDGDGDGDAEVEEPRSPTVSTSTQVDSFEKLNEIQANGHSHKGMNGHAPSPAVQSPVISESKRTLSHDLLQDSIVSTASDTTDTSSRLEAMSQDREILRSEVEQLRKSLEDLQVKHTEEISTVRAELEESESAKDQAQTQYQNLLGRINTIKSTLGERMAEDRVKLAEAKDQIDELEAQNEILKSSAENLESSVSRINRELEETSKELSSLRNRHNISQQNWITEREDLQKQIKHFKDEAEASKEAMGDWEVLAMEERSIREGLAERVVELDDQLSGHKESYERAAAERDSQLQTVEGLQRALHEIQEARKLELREMVESTQSQVDVLNKHVTEVETRATKAESTLEELRKELERATPFEKEVKEKNLLIGKLRHEAIILNDHLAKAFRLLKKAKPEDNVDRQIVTSYLLQFLALDRSDAKKFQILQLIAMLLNWTEEQKEQAGLARPGTSGGSLRIPLSPFHRTPSTPSLSTEFFSETHTNKESLAELWTGFLERQAEEGSTTMAPSSASVSSNTPTPRPDTRE